MIQVDWSVENVDTRVISEATTKWSVKKDSESSLETIEVRHTITVQGERILKTKANSIAKVFKFISSASLVTPSIELLSFSVSTHNKNLTNEQRKVRNTITMHCPKHNNNNFNNAKLLFTKKIRNNEMKIITIWMAQGNDEKSSRSSESLCSCAEAIHTSGSRSQVTFEKVHRIRWHHLLLI